MEIDFRAFEDKNLYLIFSNRFSKIVKYIPHVFNKKKCYNDIQISVIIGFQKTQIIKIKNKFRKIHNFHINYYYLSQGKIISTF